MTGRISEIDEFVEAAAQVGELSAVARSAGLYEETEDYPKALAAYRDLMDYAEDPELVAAATGRATELEAFINQ